MMNEMDERDDATDEDKEAKEKELNNFCSDPFFFRQFFFSDKFCLFGNCGTINKKTFPVKSSTSNYTRFVTSTKFRLGKRRAMLS